MILSVKAGKPSVAHGRDLRGVIEREDAQIGVLLTFEEPTQPMRAEVAGAGYYDSPGWNTSYPRMQLYTVGELLAGKQVNFPRATGITFRRAPKAASAAAPSEQLF